MNEQCACCGLAGELEPAWVSNGRGRGEPAKVCADGLKCALRLNAMRAPKKLTIAPVQP